MFIVGLICLLIVVILSILILCGLPLGELTMGGQFKTFTGKMKLILFSQLFVQVFFIIVFMQINNKMPMWFSNNTTRIIAIIMAIYLSLNTLMNLISKSKKERYIMTPLSLLTSISFWISVLN